MADWAVAAVYDRRPALIERRYNLWHSVWMEIWILTGPDTAAYRPL